ncbi:MAG: glutathione S-transferase family protein, partial [Marinicaulis sp.]|nr:glutathione S-transferase family protein [Marinicaulis sp.]
GDHKRENDAAAGHGTEKSVLASINHAISGKDFILGDTFSAADVVFGSTLNFATMFGAIEKSGAIADYVDRITARPAFAKMMEANTNFAADLNLS